MKPFQVFVVLILLIATMAFAASSFKLPQIPANFNQGLEKADEAYSPQKGKGYMEVWGFWALGNDGAILIVQYMISNTGLQNYFPGYNITYIPKGGETISIYNEFDADTLAADKSGFNIKFPNAQAGGNHPLYKARLTDPEIQFDLAFTALSPGAKLAGDARIRYGKNHDDFFVRVVLAPKAKVAGAITIDGKTTTFTGAGYVDHMVQTSFATSFSTRWYSFKFFSEKLTVIHLGFTPSKSYNEKYIGQTMVIKEGKIKHITLDGKVAPAKYRTDEISKYVLPKEVAFAISDPGCKLNFTAKTDICIDRVNVLSRVNKITAGLIGAFFAKPYLFRFHNNGDVKVDFGNGSETHSGQILSQLSVLRK